MDTTNTNGAKTMNAELLAALEKLVQNTPKAYRNTAAWTEARDLIAKAKQQS
jgi:hypothetical protein